MDDRTVFVLATITALLKSFLENMVIQQLAHMPIGNVTITALPPDRIPTGKEESPQLNLYLYRITPHAGRSQLSTFTRPDESSTGQPLLALDLHYMVSAYGEQELQAEVLLDCAMQFFHQTPLLTQDILLAKLRSLAEREGPGKLDHALVVGAAPLIAQMSPLKLIPEFLSMEEMIKLWSSFQAHARPAMTYHVSTAFLMDALFQDGHAGSMQAGVE